MRALPIALAGVFLPFRSAFLEAQEAAPRPVEVLRAEAERVLALVDSPGARRFLEATSALPTIADRIVFTAAGSRDALTAEEHARLAPEAQAKYSSSTYGEDFYYTTKYGTPIAYARVLDLIGRLTAGAGVDALAGKRLLDFGYGGIGHLRLLASLGCDAVGVDVDPLLHAYYRAEDQGAIPAARADGKAGTLRLVHGQWPGDERVKREVDGGFDLILSKNVLKLGYIRPAQSVDPAMLVQLGVSPQQFLSAVAGELKPGGVFAIYNLCPAPRADRYIPWAYGRSPFTREEFAAAGLDVLAFDVDDREQAMELAWALKWDEQGMDVEHDLFAWYTIARKPAG